MSGADRPVLVTGGAGFIGAHLALRLAENGRRVVALDNFSRAGARARAQAMLRRAGARITLFEADVRDAAALRDAIAGAAAVFHLAAQVAVTTSLADPAEDCAVNVTGTLNVLEAARAAGAPVLFASTNKVYGALEDVAIEISGQGYAPGDPTLSAFGVDEARPLDLRTPYGCSKGAADQYVLDYARTFALPAASLRMSCVYGPMQTGGEDQGWVAHFVAQALARAPITVFGDGRQVRDLLHVEDCVAAWLAAWRRIDRIAGRALNVGGGPRNAASLRAVLAHLAEKLQEPPLMRYAPWRAGDQRWYVSDIRAARASLGLAAPRGWREGIDALLSWMKANPALEPAR